MKTYKTAIEIQMQLFFETLTEKDKRQYAALEALKVGYGGQTYIAQVLGISTKTIQRGLREIDENNRPPADRIRRKGAGRKPFDKKKAVDKGISGCVVTLHSRRPNGCRRVVDTSESTRNLSAHAGKTCGENK